MYFDSNVYREPYSGPPAPDGQPPRKRGRPPGSKNRPKPEGAPESAAAILGRPYRAGSLEERFVDEAGPGQNLVRREESVREPGPIATDPEFERILRETADFKRFGSGARSPMLFVQDVSPSEVAHEEEWLAGAPEVAGELAKSAIARNLLDVIHILGAESAGVVGFCHGEFRPPTPIRYGRGTCSKPWKAKVMESITTYEAHLKTHGIGMREGLVVFASDFYFSDFDAAALAGFKAFCKRKRQVVVSAMFGHPDEAVAAQFSSPIPPVDLKRVPLALFIRELTKTATQSISRHGSLKGLMARAVSGLIERTDP